MSYPSNRNENKRMPEPAHRNQVIARQAYTADATTAQIITKNPDPTTTAVAVAITLPESVPQGTPIRIVGGTAPATVNGNGNNIGAGGASVGIGQVVDYVFVSGDCNPDDPDAAVIGLWAVNLAGAGAAGPTGPGGATGPTGA